MAVRSLLDLSGKVALVTGGSRGLGLQMAEALGELGARLVITARQHGELDEAAVHLSKQGVEVVSVMGDLAKPDAATALVGRVLADVGPIDILVNNAGTTWAAPAQSHTAEA